MKKLPLIMMGLLIFSLVPYVESASVGKASIDQVMLSLGESVTFGDYKIQFADIDQAWTQALIKVYAKDGSLVTSKVLPTGYSLSVPDNDNPLFYVRLAWILRSNQKILISLESELELVEGDVQINKNDAYNLPYKFNDVVIPAIKVKVTNTYENKANVRIVLPYETITATIFEGDHYAVPYKLTSDFQYFPYLYLYLKNATTSYAVFDVYLPKYPTTVFQLGEGGAGGTTPSAPGAEPTELVYNDIMYEGENLIIDINGTEYALGLNTVGYYSSFTLFDKDNNPLKSFEVKKGTGYELSEAPLVVELINYESEYKRAYLRVYAPRGTEVAPIVRDPKIEVSVSTSSTELLLNDELLVFINVENSGRGRADNVNVVASIPTGFELGSEIGTWSLDTLNPFTEMPVLVYLLKPTQVGKYELGPVVVKYYDERGIEREVDSGNPLSITVYAIPKLSVTGEAFNGTWGTYVHTQEKTVKLKFTISAEGKDPEYEFIKNATLQLSIPDSLDGETKLYVGDLKAGETKTLESDYAILKADNAIISAKLVYQDPLGNWHEENFESLAVVNSLPPAVETKEVKVYPEPEELPSYVNTTLANLDNESKIELAEALKNISVSYLPPETGINWWPIIAILFILVSAVLGYNYVDLKGKYDKALKELGRRKRRPGGIPKKEEAQVQKVEETETTETKEEQQL
ncbi:MAG: DNA cytosine methyltransferase [Thermococcus sp.]|uniref:DNA cytosine methyltransferase n=2 Tax=Thermococcus sp. TaxID=35749 RepID=UPI0026046879|nr:DNA cytosine methyltransferase [Thermococcus sp.]MCD6140807.1 DNA cytosine methyltransferase [Thermococcus sp.]